MNRPAFKDDRHLRLVNEEPSSLSGAERVAYFLLGVAVSVLAVMIRIVWRHIG